MLSMVLAAAVTVLGPANPQVWEKTATDELKTYLEKRLGGHAMTVDGNADPVFHVGDSEFALQKGVASAKFKEDEWGIISFGRDVVLNGGGTRGCLYAVYHFLEDDCGLRFWSDDEEDVPGPSDLSLPQLKRRGRPYFEYRDVYRTEKWGGAKSRTAIRRRLNRNGNAPTPLTWGGAYEYGLPYFCHTHDRYLPFATYGKEHPEWYALRDGKRVGGERTGQLCLTNPEVVAKMTELVISNIENGAKIAAANGEAAPRMYDLTHNDNQFYCLCPACTEAEARYGRSGIMLNFVNAIAAEVAKTHPEIVIHVCAYEYTEPVPKGGVKAAPNVIVELNNTTGNKARPIQHRTNDFFRNELVKWRDYTTRLAASDFSVTYRKDSMNFPYPNEYVYDELLGFFATNGVTAIFLQHDRPLESDMHEVKYYVESRLLEDPFLDGDTLVETAIREYYGAAGEDVLAVRRRLRGNFKRYNANVTWFPYPYEFFNFIREDDIAFFREKLDAAEAAAKGDERILRRLRRSRIGWNRFFERFAATQVETDEGWVTPAALFSIDQKRLAKLVDDSSVAGGKVVVVNRSEPEYAKDVSFGSYNILDSERSPISGTLRGIPEDGKYRWYKLGVTDTVENGWLLFFGPVYNTIQMSYRPMRAFEGKKVEVSLELKADKDHLTLSRLRFVPKK